MDDDPRLAKGDRDMIEAAAAGDSIVLTDELFEVFARAAKETMDGFEAEFAAMTSEQAGYVRTLRCDLGYSWRAVAQTCALEWGGGWGSSQLAGIAICERAAHLHAEDSTVEPWN